MIAEWYDARKLTAPKLSWLPTVGFIADNLAVGFAYVADGKLAIIEGYITDPKAGLKARNSALNEITSALLTELSKKGIERVFVTTTVKPIVKRAINFGFKGKATVLLIKELN